MWIGTAPLIDHLHELLMVVHRVGGDGHCVLMKIGFALGDFGLQFGAGQPWKQQRRQNRNNGDDNQQLDQSKCLAFWIAHNYFWFKRTRIYYPIQWILSRITPVWHIAATE